MHQEEARRVPESLCLFARHLPGSFSYWLLSNTQILRLDVGFKFCICCLLKQIPGVAATCDISAIMDGYYKTLFPLNASGIQPAIASSGDQDSLLRPHYRDLVGKAIEAQPAV